MAKIPFTLEAWLKDKSQKVETGEGESVQILCTNAEGVLPIIGNVGVESENLQRWTEKGQYHVGLNTPDKDLFIITPEPEMSEWQTLISGCLQKYGLLDCGAADRIAKECSAELLSLARKELENESPSIIHAQSFNAGLKRGKQETLKDLPRWKRAAASFGNYSVAPTETGALCLLIDRHYIMLSELMKLPGFKEEER